MTPLKGIDDEANSLALDLGFDRTLVLFKEQA